MRAAAQEAAPAEALAAPRPAAAARAIDEATLLLFEVNYNDLSLTDGLAAYGDPDDPFIPVGELTRLLELDVEVQPAAGRAVGRIGEAGRSLLLDINTLTARDGSRAVALTAADVAVSPNEIYLRASAMQRLFPLIFTVAADALAIRLKSTELLPIESRLQRDLRAKMLTVGGGPGQETLKVDTPYKLFTPPAFDIGLGLGAQSNTPRFPTRYDIRIGGDLLYSNFQGYVGSDERGDLQSARATFERRSLNGGLLGPLKARVVAVGDVFTPSLDIGPRSVGGRGVVFSTAPLDQASIFNRIDLRGELPVGYDVELYVNDVLVGTRNQSTNEGRYEFLNVILRPGLNVIRTVLYGGRGERKEERRVINVGAGLLNPGEATLAFGAVEQDVPLFRVGPFQSSIASQIFTGGPRIVGALNYGLTSRLTLVSGLGLYSTPFMGEQRIATAGARTSLFGFATQVDAAVNDDGGSGVTVGVLGRVLNTSVVAKHSEYRGGLVDENVLAADPTRGARNATEINLDTTFRLGRRSYPLSFRGYHLNFTDGASQSQANLSGSSAFGPALISLGGAYENFRSPGLPDQERLSGSLGVSTYRNYVWQLRGALEYEFAPEVRARTLEITADRHINEDWTLRFGVSKPFDVKNGASVAVSSISRTRYGDFSVIGGYDNQNKAWRVGVQNNFGLSFNPALGRYAVTPPGPGAGGAVLLRAFLDANGDGVFNPGEEPVPNVVLEGGLRRVSTNVDGFAYATGFGTQPAARLTVDTEAVQNTMSVSSPPAVVQFSPRAGSLTRIDYPLRPTGEIGVRILLRRPDNKRVGLSATQIRLVDQSGAVIKGVTEFDGTALLQSIPLGTYELALDPDQAARLKLKLTKPITFQVTAEGQSDVMAEVQFEGQPLLAEDTAAPEITEPAPPPRSGVTVNLDDTSESRPPPIRRTFLPAVRPPPSAGAAKAADETDVRIALRGANGRLVGLIGAHIQLLGPSGAVVARAVTGAGGVARVKSPAPGTYRLALDRTQAQLLRMHLTNPVDITVGAETGPTVLGEVRYDLAD